MPACLFHLLRRGMVARQEKLQCGYYAHKKEIEHGHTPLHCRPAQCRPPGRNIPRILDILPPPAKRLGLTDALRQSFPFEKHAPSMNMLTQKCCMDRLHKQSPEVQAVHFHCVRHEVLDQHINKAECVRTGRYDRIAWVQGHDADFVNSWVVAPAMVHTARAKPA